MGQTASGLRVRIAWETANFGVHGDKPQKGENGEVLEWDKSRVGSPSAKGGAVLLRGPCTKHTHKTKQKEINDQEINTSTFFHKAPPGETPSSAGRSPWRRTPSSRRWATAP